MVKTIDIGGRPVKFKATAAVPRLYRIRYRRDIMRDMRDIDAAVKAGDDMPVKMLQVFEDLAYTMAKHADPDNVPDSADEWLDQFDVFDIYQVFPQLAELWADNMETLEKPKKK